MNDSISSKLLDKDLHYPIYLKNQNMNFMIIKRNILTDLQI